MTDFLLFLPELLVFLWLGVHALGLLAMVLTAAWVEGLGYAFTDLAWPRPSYFASNVCASLLLWLLWPAHPLVHLNLFLLLLVLLAGWRKHRCF